MAMNLSAVLAAIGSPRRTRAAWWCLGGVAVVAMAAGLSWGFKARDNAVIAAGQALVQAQAQGGNDAEFENATPALLFAQAHELAAADKMEPALARYRALYRHPALSGAARYNSANLLMRQALSLRDSDAQGQALPLIELAKQGYREVLRADPGHWDARYNYERAQRAQPDPDDIDAPIGEPRAQAERSPTTTRGVGGGLP
jgi:mxaK protein